MSEEAAKAYQALMEAIFAIRAYSQETAPAVEAARKLLDAAERAESTEARVKELERENELEIKDKLTVWERALAAEREAAAARGELKRFGSHKTSCAATKEIGRMGSRSGLGWSVGDEKRCDCGLSDAIGCAP